MKGKKLVCLFLCCLLGFSLFGCSKAEEAQAPATPPLEISLLQDGKFAVTCEQFISAYEDILAISRWGANWTIKEDDGSFQVFDGEYSATLAFSKSGGEGEDAVTAGLHERMDTIAVSCVYDSLEKEFSDGIFAVSGLILALNPDMLLDDAKQILIEMTENLQSTGNNSYMSKKEVNGVTYTLGVARVDMFTSMFVLSASTDPNVTVQM